MHLGGQGPPWQTFAPLEIHVVSVSSHYALKNAWENTEKAMWIWPLLEVTYSTPTVFHLEEGSAGISPQRPVSPSPQKFVKEFNDANIKLNKITEVANTK